MNNDSHRVISIVLNEQEWQAFIRVHPQPVVWLRERIQESIAPPSGAEPISAFVPAAAAASTTSATTR
jgi:hypothetical protein